AVEGKGQRQRQRRPGREEDDPPPGAPPRAAQRQQRRQRRRGVFRNGRPPGKQARSGVAEVLVAAGILSRPKDLPRQQEEGRGPRVAEEGAGVEEKRSSEEKGRGHERSLGVRPGAAAGNPPP